MVGRIEAESPAARTLLLDSLPVLREQLEKQDIRVQQFDVDLLDRQSSNSHDLQQDPSQDNDSRPNDTVPSEELDETLEANTSGASQEWRDGNLDVMI